MNRGDHFEARPLPDEAQFAPAFGVSVGDLDGDGREDVVLSQNFFGVEPETSRYDAGRGLLLIGDGRGGFEAVSGQESGIKLDGEQRGCALADFDGDGRCDLAIGQNSGFTALYRNVGGAPGLRVRLRGPAGNPDGIGAMIRLKYRDRFGPARLLQAGSGYWSQESVIQVLGHIEPPTDVWVRWQGGISHRSTGSARRDRADHLRGRTPTDKQSSKVSLLSQWLHLPRKPILPGGCAFLVNAKARRRHFRVIASLRLMFYFPMVYAPD